MSASDFVGRAEERSVLGRFLERPAQGRGGLVVVVGEAGMGKTRLVETTVASSGLPALWARARSSTGAPALWMWEQVARAARARSWPGPAAADTAVPVAGTGYERFRRFDELATWLTSLAAREPCVVALDDLQWADADSLDLLEFVAPDLAAVPLVVIATSRPGELAALPRADLVVTLGGLGADDLTLLLAELTASDPTPELVDAVARSTGGSPFFVGEVVRLLQATGNATDPAHWRGVLPEGVRSVLNRRFARLAQATQDTLASAAALGVEIDATVLAAVLDADRSDVFDRLAPAVDTGLLRDLGDGRFVFAHALVHEAARHAAGSASRRRVHERAAEVLEAMRGTRAAPEIATHLVAAGDAAAAAAWAAVAGDVAYRAAMYADAAEWYGRALASTHHPAPSLRVRHADALSRAGDTEQADVEYAVAAREAREAGDPEVLSRAALGIGTLGGGFEVRLLDDAKLALLAEALERLPGEDSVVRAILMARLSVASTLQAEQTARVGLAEDALAMAHRLGDDGAIAYALGAWCDAHAGPRHTPARLEATSEMLVAAHRAGDPELELLARRLRIVALMEAGDIALASHEIDLFARLADTLRQPQFCWYARLVEGMRALLRGDVEEAERLGRLASALGREARSANAEMIADGALLPMIARERGDESFAARVDEINSLHPEAARGMTVAPLYAVGYGASREAVRRCLAVLDPFTMIGPDDGLFLQALALTGDGAAFVGDESLMARIEEAGIPFADRFVLDGTAAVCYGPLVSTLARIAAARGDVELARRRFERALELLQHAGAPLLAAGIERELAGLVPGPTTGPTMGTAELRRDGDVWFVAYAGGSARLRHTKGLGDLAILLARPGRDVHVFDLVAAAEGHSAPDAPRSASTGPVIDARARATYERRIRELTEEIDEAEARHDDARAARLDDERAALLGQLARALGLSGRARQVGSDVERARKAVAMRLRDTITRLDKELPALGRHLRHAVHTGTFCAYRPEHPVEWRC